MDEDRYQDRICKLKIADAKHSIEGRDDQSKMADVLLSFVLLRRDFVTFMSVLIDRLCNFIKPI